MAELLATTSAREMREWEAFERLEPWGDEWRQAAMLCSLIASVHTGREFPLETFMPVPVEPEEEQTAEEVRAILAARGCTIHVHDQHARG